MLSLVEDTVDHNGPAIRTRSAVNYPATIFRPPPPLNPIDSVQPDEVHTQKKTKKKEIVERKLKQKNRVLTTRWSTPAGRTGLVCLFCFLFFFCEIRKERRRTPGTRRRTQRKLLLLLLLLLLLPETRGVAFCRFRCGASTDERPAVGPTRSPRQPLLSIDIESDRLPPPPPHPSCPLPTSATPPLSCFPCVRTSV